MGAVPVPPQGVAAPAPRRRQPAHRLAARWRKWPAGLGSAPDQTPRYGEPLDVEQQEAAGSPPGRSLSRPATSGCSASTPTPRGPPPLPRSWAGAEAPRSPHSRCRPQPATSPPSSSPPPRPSSSPRPASRPRKAPASRRCCPPARRRPPRRQCPRRRRQSAAALPTRGPRHLWRRARTRGRRRRSVRARPPRCPSPWRLMRSCSRCSRRPPRSVLRPRAAATWRSRTAAAARRWARRRPPPGCGSGACRGRCRASGPPRGPESSTLLNPTCTFVGSGVRLESKCEVRPPQVRLQALRVYLTPRTSVACLGLAEMTPPPS